jgi:lipopolysaccharide transport system permease protein
MLKLLKRAVIAITDFVVRLSALNVQYRDIRYVVPFLTQFWLFATPIAYLSSLLSEPWRSVYAINPIVGVV